MELIEEETTTKEYVPGTFDKITALDEYLVPHIYTADLEDIADDFTEFYCCDAIYDMYQFPINHLRLCRKPMLLQPKYQERVARKQKF